MSRALAVLLVLLSGCATHHNPAQSWDQANLKRNDTADCKSGNPVFVAPGGNLTQC